MAKQNIQNKTSLYVTYQVENKAIIQDHPASAPGVPKAMVCAIQSVGLCL